MHPSSTCENTLSEFDAIAMSLQLLHVLGRDVVDGDDWCGGVDRRASSAIFSLSRIARCKSPSSADAFGGIALRCGGVHGADWARVPRARPARVPPPRSPPALPRWPLCPRPRCRLSLANHSSPPVARALPRRPGRRGSLPRRGGNRRPRLGKFIPAHSQLMIRVRIRRRVADATPTPLSSSTPRLARLNSALFRTVSPWRRAPPSLAHRVKPPLPSFHAHLQREQRRRRRHRIASRILNLQFQRLDRILPVRDEITVDDVATVED